MKIKQLPVGVLLGAMSIAAGTATLAADSGDQAKIGRAAAEKTALSRVPGGRIKEGELEKEHGKLVWSFDIEKHGSSNIIEIQVDAMDGKIVSQVTETPAEEAKESAVENAKASKSH